MMAQLIKLYFKGKPNTSNTAVKKAYASLSSIAGIILNLLLCTAKIMTGFFSRSVAISADGFNNLSDAGISLMTLLGFQIARYGRGSTHPFGHGRLSGSWGFCIPCRGADGRPANPYFSPIHPPPSNAVIQRSNRNHPGAVHLGKRLYVFLQPSVCKGYKF